LLTDFPATLPKNALPPLMKSRSLALAALCAALTISGATAPAETLDRLATGFREPPDSAKPHLWWHWMNGNVSRSGITKDLEAMKAVGVGGVVLFEEADRIAPGPIRYGSDEHFALIGHSIRESDRLGLNFAFMNGPGWSSTGGPWITPDQAMKHLTWSTEQVEGGNSVVVHLARPTTLVRPYPELGPPARYPKHYDYYRDVAVLAFPTPPAPGWRLDDWKEKADFRTADRLREQRTPMPPGAAIDEKSIVNLSARMRADGTLDWVAPPGSWTVMRFGYTLTEHANRVGPTNGGTGLECDKLSREAVDFHWNAFIAKVLGSAPNKHIYGIMIDSYEPLTQTWTPRMPEDFKKLRSYDLLPFLPCLTGRVVGNVEQSERFLWDWRRTLADLVAKNYYGRFEEKCRERGIKFAAEAYGGAGAMFDEFQVDSELDIPMGEFWFGKGKANWTSLTGKLAASGADLAGRHLVGAEAYTTTTGMAAWTLHPYQLKAEGDFYFCRGITRFYIQASAHQPWSDSIRPGMTMGPHGIQMNRNNTWWKPSRAWLAYLARSQYLLQQGQLVADVFFEYGDNAPASLRLKHPHGPNWETWDGGEHVQPDVWLPFPAGRDYLVGNADVVNRMAVDDRGRIELPNGLRCEVLLLPDDDHMQLGILRKLAQLVKDGATVVGPRPTKSPTLQDGMGDAAVRTLADELWADIDGKRVTSHRFGKGTVWYGVGLEQILKSRGIPPDFEYRSVGEATTAETPRLDFIHRKTDDGEFYFVSNQRRTAAAVECTFRADGQPEIWQPETGAERPATLWRPLAGGRTVVRLNLEPEESCFVVFRRGAHASTPALATFTRDGRPVTSDHDAILRWTDGRPEVTAFVPGAYAVADARGARQSGELGTLPAALDLSDDWKIAFPTGLGAPEGCVMPRLESLASNKVDGIRYFSGTATYTKNFHLPAGALSAGAHAVLSLGDVDVMADLAVNGHNFGILWKPPFRRDVTAALREGDNTITVQVTTLWKNRLIGDARIQGVTPAESQRRLSADVFPIPDWVREGKPNPDPRVVTWTVFPYFNGDMPLVPSGLVGPVQLHFGRSIMLR